jgi:hypothetical protein
LTSGSGRSRIQDSIREIVGRTDESFKAGRDKVGDRVACNNCKWSGYESQLKSQFPYIPNLLDRIFPGEEVPVGECPECGALCHLTRERK